MSAELKSTFSNLRLSRRQAASEAYHYVKNVLAEPDEEEYLQAAVLEDLFDCKVCVMSVAQVFLKGIVLPREERIFGMEDILEEIDLEQIRDRILHKEKRIPPRRLGGAAAKNVGTVDIEKEYGARIIDVRDEENFCRDYIPEVEQSTKVENLPLEEIIINPHILGDDKYAPILFVCAKGIKSSKAAFVAVKAGYRQVFYGHY